MSQKSVRTLAALFLIALLTGCAGQSSVVPVVQPPGTTAAASLSLRDAPPAGVTVLSFELTVSGAVLQPGNVSLVSTPMVVEVKQLEVQSALLSTLNVPAGTYNSLAVTVSNPELTIQNNSNVSIVIGTSTCLVNAICELKPPLSSSSVTINFSPTLTITAGTPVDLRLDLDLANSIPTSLGPISPTFSISQLPAVSGTPQLEDLEDLVGTVNSKDSANSSFILQTDPAIAPLTIKVDSNTKFEDFDETGCSAGDFTCIATGQMVEVDASLLAGGMLVAKKVGIENEDQNPQELKGVIATIASPTQFQIVVLDEMPNINNVSVGNALTVHLLPNTKFSIQKGDTDRLDLMGLTFATGSDLLVGQFVQIRPAAPVTGTPPAVDTDRVRLKKGSLTATVKAPPTGTDFTVNNLSSLFTTAGITEIDVRASATDFEDDHSSSGGLSGLKAGDTVSVRGLLFKTLSGNPVLVASKVRKR